MKMTESVVDRGRQYYRRTYVLTCACGCGIQFEHPYVKKYFNRTHWYAFKKGKTIDELFGASIADDIRQRLSDLSKGKPSFRRGKTDVELLGVEGAKRKAQKLSIIASDALDRGVLGPNASIKEWVFNPFTQQDEFMHSSWETAFLRFMIAHDVPVTKKHSLRIKYDMGDGVIRTYTPDFVQLNALVVYEVKGHMSTKDEHKIAALREWAGKNSYVVNVVDKKLV